MPTILGEKLVIRVLDKGKLEVRLDRLGFRPTPLEHFTDALRAPHGLVLVTGPTGSGKTTTLYSGVELLRGPGVNIVTVEDPVEYQLELMNQIQVNEQIGLTFARALRSILRQDPDVIMVGEIRDEETARVAVQAALTGHTVLATLHTNDAPSTVARMRDMRIEAYLIASALNAVVAQRLGRTICKTCTTTYYPSDDALADAGLTAHAGKAFRRGQGCQQCHDSGFQGRLGIYEVMPVTSEIRQLIYSDAGTDAVRNALRRLGIKTLREEAVLHAVEGRTSLEEALRVTQGDDFGDAAEPPAATVTPAAAPTPPGKEAA
jgi:type IV pilus assembly protein PilB